MKLAILLVYCLALLPVRALAADDGYGYPIEGSYEATILGTPVNMMPKFPAQMRTRDLVLDVIPGRDRPPIFFYDEGLRCTLAYQKKKAPLVFLIGGAGSSGSAPKLVTMTKAFYQAGYHVITLPSTSNSNFIISASQGRVPGDLTEDASDLYRAMETAWNEVKGDIEVSDFNLCGFSLGGTQAAFVAKLDDDRGLFNFRKVLMINPSVSLYSSITRIEELLHKIPGGPKKEGAFFNRMLTKFGDYYRFGNFVGINDEFIYAIYQQRLFTPEETGGLIALAYRINLAGMIFSSDVMTGGGYVVPRNRELTLSDSLFDYFLVSCHLSFFDYFNEYFYPHFQKIRPGLTKEALIASESLRSIDGYLKSHPKFGVMGNEDDFILTKPELAYLKETFGPRAKIYPRGGHLGNLEFKDNLAYMVEFFTGIGGKP
jgi:pimeloyl-ACP methyl ester carboxylesterase